MRLVVFSGTGEGHALCRLLSARGAQADVYVATEYGAAVMEPLRGITIHEGRLDEQEIAARLDADTLLIDATHPYAAVVTDNLRAACAKTGARYERLLRPALETVYFRADRAAVSASMVRELRRFGESASAYVPPAVLAALDACEK